MQSSGVPSASDDLATRLENVAESPVAATDSPPGTDSPNWEELELTALLGPGTTLTGRLSFAGKVRIDGVVEGDLLGGELLVVGPRAVVRGHVSAHTVIVLGGRVEGDITARGSIELRVPSIVKGDLEAPRIFLDRGVDFVGRCQMHPLTDD